MRTRSSTTRTYDAIRTALLVGAGLAVIACQDTRVPVAPQQAALRLSQAAGVSASPTAPWDYYESDVTVDVTGAGTPRAAAKPLPMHLAYHMERSLQATGVWTITVSYEPGTPPGEMTPGVPQRDIARVETDDAGSFLRMYGRNGAPIAMPDRAFARRQRPVRSTAARRTPADPRQWADASVITVAAQQRASDQLRKAFGAPVGKVRTLDHYTRQAGTVTQEILVDPVVGVPVEETVMRDGVVEQHTTHEFTQVSDGVFLQTTTRIERPATTRHPQPVTIVRTERNVRFAIRRTN